MIVDLFLYNGEQDLLDVRVYELLDVVDLFVPVIANRTHQGDPHPPDDDLHEIDGPAWVSFVDLSDLDHLGRGGVGSPDYQKRERAHRDRALGGLQLAGVDDDTMILLSDVDEIPTEWAVKIADGEVREHTDDVFQFEQTMYGFAIDWRMPQPWPGTTAASLGWAREHGVQAMRDARGDDCTTIAPGGWHFSWLGGPDEWVRKQQSFSHAELNHRGRDDFLKHWREGVHSNGEVLEPVEIDDTYPRLMRDPEWVVPEWWRRPRDPA